RKATPSLSEALKDSDGHVKVSAALALWKIEGKIDPSVPVLIEILKGEKSDSLAPQGAAGALGEIGPPAKAAVPHLTAALRHDSRDFRISAAIALWKITRNPEPTVPALARALLQDRDVVE